MFILNLLYVLLFLEQELLSERSVSKFDPSLMDRWHVTGCSQNKVLSGLISKLNERLVSLSITKNI